MIYEVRQGGFWVDLDEVAAVNCTHAGVSVFLSAGAEMIIGEHEAEGLIKAWIAHSKGEEGLEPEPKRRAL